MPAIDPKKIEREYRDAKARERAAQRDQQRWDKRTGLANLRRKFEALDDADRKAHMRMAETCPTTPEGAASLLAYVAADMETITREWHTMAVKTVVASLWLMAQGNNLPASQRRLDGRRNFDWLTMIKCGLAYRSARERRRVAVHEAGHVVMARLFGLTLLRALIAPDEGSWHGSVQVAPVGQLHPRAVARLVGVAGKAAELCWTDRHYDVLDEDWWHPGTLSESDWAQTDACPALRIRPSSLRLIKRQSSSGVARVKSKNRGRSGAS